MPDDDRILVLVTTRASPDGTAVHRYVEGETYGPETDPPMPAGLAATFLREGWGEAIKDAANRKRSETQKGILKADKNVPGTEARSPCPPLIFCEVGDLRIPVLAV